MPTADAVAAAHPGATQTAIRWVPLETLSGLTLWPEVLHRRRLALASDGLPLAPEYVGVARWRRGLRSGGWHNRSANRRGIARQ